MSPSKSRHAANKIADSDARLPDDPALLTTAVELFAMAAECKEPGELLSGILSVLPTGIKADYVVLAAAVSGRWSVRRESGKAHGLPADLLAEALDRERAVKGSGWIAVPLTPRQEEGEALVFHLSRSGDSEKALAIVERLSPVFGRAIAFVESRLADRRRLRRLETVLEIAALWNRAREVEPLLVQMAEAAAGLLDADRASIFIWDRSQHTLVGRPALGAPGGELRVRDDRGVVGEVIRSGRPRRIDAAAEPESVDRSVDEQLGYETRTLLCVPMRGRDGELFGVFELINKHGGMFTKEDEEALGDLAAQAGVALENTRDRQRLLSATRQYTQQEAEKARLIGNSPPVEALRSIVRRVSDTDLAVLIQGENGTGKEIVAQSIHYLGSRRDRPFVAVNCAAIPETLAESELFGHERGAFTDAREARAGKFEQADGGTLFLDEIGDLSLACQAKLLRVIEERVLARVGGSTPIRTDARLLAATNQDLAEMVRRKRFREDLYFRLNVVAIDLPPLRERGDDVLLLFDHFLDEFCRRARRKKPKLSAAAKKRLLEHAWPGNVRELRNLVERLAYLSTEDRIEADQLAFILSPRDRQPATADLDQSLAEATVRFQTDYIRRQIVHSGGNMSAAAERLGLHRSNLYRKMRQLGME